MGIIFYAGARIIGAVLLAFVTAVVGVVTAWRLLAALWHAHGVIGVMLLAVVIGQAVIGVLGSRWARQGREETRMSQQEVIDAVTEQLGKASAEIKAEIEKLANANPALDLSGLVAAAQGLDDIVPDVEPEPEPEPEPSTPLVPLPEVTE